MRKNLHLLGIALCGALGLTSCLSSTDKSETTQTFTYSTCFNAVTNENDGSVYINRSIPSYSFVYHSSFNNPGSLEVTVSNLQFSATSNPIVLKLPPLSFDQTREGFLESSGTMLNPANQGTSSIYLFNDFKCSNLPGISVYNVDYRITNSYTATTYRVRAYSTRYVYRGNVTSNSESYSTVTESSLESGLMVTINPETMMGTLTIDRIKVNEGQSESFAVANLPIVLTSQGYTITTDATELQLMNSSLSSQRQGWTIKNININASLSTGADITFTLVKEDSGDILVSALNQTYYPAYDGN